MRRQTLIYCPVWSVCLLWCEYEGLIYFDLQIVDGSSIRTNKEGIVEDQIFQEKSRWKRESTVSRTEKTW